MYKQKANKSKNIFLIKIINFNIALFVMHAKILTFIQCLKQKVITQLFVTIIKYSSHNINLET
jgi:hypothetical protein